MRGLRQTQVLQFPHVSEKATSLADKNRQHVFVIDRAATKGDVKNAVEKQFQVKVQAVNLLNMKGKKKRMAGRRQEGRRKHWKKAYVTLQEGHDIELAGTS